MEKKSKIIVFSFGIVCLLLAIFGGYIGSGNYGYAQKYEFEINNSTLINAVENLKSKDSTYIPPYDVYNDDFLDT